MSWLVTVFFFLSLFFFVQFSSQFVTVFSVSLYEFSVGLPLSSVGWGYLPEQLMKVQWVSGWVGGRKREWGSDTILQSLGISCVVLHVVSRTGSNGAPETTSTQNSGHT